MTSKETEDKVTPITERENTWPNCTPWLSGKQNWQAKYVHAQKRKHPGQMLRACPDKNVRKEMNER